MSGEGIDPQINVKYKKTFKIKIKYDNRNRSSHKNKNYFLNV